MSPLTGLVFLVLSTCAANLAPVTEALRQHDSARALTVLETLRSGCGEGSSEFHEYAGLANEMAGRAAEAEAELQHAVSLDLTSSRLLTELGATYLRHGRIADAATVLDKALAVEPSNQPAMRYDVATAVQIRAWAKAYDLFHRLHADEHPEALRDQPILLVWFVETLLETHHGEQIEKLLPPERWRNDSSFLFSAGTLLAKHGSYASAIDYLKRVSARDADDAVYFNLGLAYSHLGQFEAAKACYFQAIDKRPEHADAYFHVGLDYASSGDPRRAVPWLLRASAMGSTRPDVVYALVGQLLSLGYSQSAEEILTKARKEGLDDPILDVAQGDVVLAGGQPRAAAELYQRALQANPDLAFALVGLARVSLAAGDEERAQQQLEKALAVDPDDPVANRELGLIQARKNDRERAQAHLLHAWARGHSDLKVGIELARLYRLQQQPLKALALLKSINSEHADSTLFHFELYKTYLALNRSTEAQKELVRFNELQASTHEALHFEASKTYIH